MKSPPHTVTVPPIVKHADAAPHDRSTTEPRSPVVASPLIEDIEPRLPRTPVRPTPTGVVFPDPIFPPKFDGQTRTANVPILMYHYISTPPLATDKIRVGLSVTPEMFEAQVKLLIDNGFTTITLFDLYEHLATGKALPDKPIVLTFDDGYVDNYEQAFPILKKYEQIGTFFVLTGPADVKDPAYMSWEMVKEMSSAGMDMQLHSKDHVDLRHRRYEDLVWQIIGGRQSIEGHTGKPVVFMAYPSGKYDSTVVKFLSDNNFWGAVTTQSGRTHSINDALTWTRIRVAGQLRLVDYAKLLGLPRS
ncbi:MAG: polysaccharide deacetylase family protein [Chloroflexi bacterium]|nr:polysaccharide deacetylase family protein [Chloroflexota bacterium]